MLKILRRQELAPPQLGWSGKPLFIKATCLLGSLQRSPDPLICWGVCKPLPHTPSTLPALSHTHKNLPPQEGLTPPMVRPIRPVTIARSLEGHRVGASFNNEVLVLSKHDHFKLTKQQHSQT